MRVLVIGSGGREHAICSAFRRSKYVPDLFCAPGNAGIAGIAELVAIKPEDIDALADFTGDNDINLTFVGGETALALGIVDKFEARGLKIVGASGLAARLEASKTFAKDFMLRNSVPTAKYAAAGSAAEAIKILDSGEFGNDDAPVVVKADGLAAGKGVVVAENRGEAITAINEMSGRVGADAAASFVLEECLTGREVSLLMFADGENFALMPPTRDHKRIGDGDTGPNTGGMGTITDSSLLTDEQTGRIIEEIIKPTLNGCAEEGFPFRGILFLGLMMTEVSSEQLAVNSKEHHELRPAAANRQLQARLLEYNVRFGDPETQSILVRLETDIVDICEAMLAGTLDKMPISWREGNSATIVLAAKGYPDNPQTGDVIHGLENAKLHDDVSIFHAGTAFSSPPIKGEVDAASADGVVVSSGTEDNFATSGGRVLGVTAMADSLREALGKAYEAVNDISWDGMQYRKDIGK